MPGICHARFALNLDDPNPDVSYSCADTFLLDRASSELLCVNQIAANYIYCIAQTLYIRPYELDLEQQGLIQATSG